MEIKELLKNKQFKTSKVQSWQELALDFIKRFNIPAKQKGIVFKFCSMARSTPGAINTIIHHLEKNRGVDPIKYLLYRIKQ